MIKENKILKFEIITSIIASIIGTLLHFTYEWIPSKIVAPVSAVNESTWEHLKLLFFPFLLIALISYVFLHKEYPNYICTKTKSIFFSLLFQTMFFYTYTGIIGKSIDIINIASFFLTIIISEIYFFHKLKENKSCNNTLALISLFIMTIAFILFTFTPPKIGIFKDPITSTYGIYKS